MRGSRGGSVTDDVRRAWRVLVVPGGTEIGLEINRALRDCKEVDLYSAGQKVPSASEFRFRRHIPMPPISDQAGLAALNAIIERNDIDFVFPAHDDVVLALAENRAAIKAAVLGSEPRVCQITRFKSLTYKAVAGIVRTPQVYQSDDELSFPVFVKPDRGQGGQGARRIDDVQTLRTACEREPSLLVMEFLPGEEYTVDCFSSRAQGLIFCRGRERTRVRAGIAMQSHHVDDPLFVEIARNIETSLPMRGAWFFQVKRDRHGDLTLLEVAPRIAGAMALSRVTGANFPLLTIYDAAGFDVGVEAFEASIELSRSLDNHYRIDFKYSAVYVDLDDTLIVNGRVNTRLVRFLYQCINEGRPVHLLTRHRHDLGETLRRHRLQMIFDTVRLVDDAVCKSEFIKEHDAIFIDDSFRERRLVARACGVKTFDSSAVECLIDERA
ncbi:hypothetical protein AX289_06435 [Methylorubrum populi]|nr:hypothetical protein AX289_06435 [Methylorubrum populi]